jgi:hypothetical protein
MTELILSNCRRYYHLRCQYNLPCKLNIRFVSFNATVRFEKSFNNRE